MKLIKIITVFVFLIILVAVSACSIGQNVDNQPQTTITKGDITVKVNGTGKTGYANIAKLAFGSSGKIKQINIQQGDAVTQGTVLASLDTANLELALSQAKVNEAAARAAVTQAQVALSQAQMALTQAGCDVIQAESAQTQAEAALTTAQFNLDRIQAVGDIKDQIMKIEMLISATTANRRQANLSNNGDSSQYFLERMDELNQELNKKNTNLQKLLAKDEYADVAPYEIMAFNPADQTFSLGGQKYNRLVVEDIRMKQQQVVIAEKSIQLAQQNILQAQQNCEQAILNVDQTRQGIDQAVLSLEQASQAVKVARQQLDTAIIYAPFDGIIANLEVKTGDYIAGVDLSTATPIYLVEPASLEINTEVDEIDITTIQVGQKALIRMDALSGFPIEGKVTAVSVLPVVKPLNSGVVVYEVKVRFADTPPEWVKSGMSANVDIVTTQKSNVITVPCKAVKQNAQGQKTVNLLVDKKSREQAITPGLSDGIQTEVLSGINEGEIVLLNP